LFYEEDNNRVSLLFDYVWTLRNHKKVSFKVVDVIALDPQNKIKELRIIYDTVSARAIFEEQKKWDNKE